MTILILGKAFEKSVNYRQLPVITRSPSLSFHLITGTVFCHSKSCNSTYFGNVLRQVLLPLGSVWWWTHVFQVKLKKLVMPVSVTVTCKCNKRNI